MRSGCGRPRAARWRSTSSMPATPLTRWPGSSPWLPRPTWLACGSGASRIRLLAEQSGLVGSPPSVTSDVLVDATDVFGVPQHHREGQVTAFEFDDGELELGGFGGQQRAQRAHGHVV